MVLREDPTCIHFHCAHGFGTQRLANMLDSLVRVSRRVAESHYASIQSVKVPEGPPKGTLRSSVQAAVSSERL